MRVAIDAGHPTTPGDVGCTAPGLVESEYTWEAAQSLMAYLRHCLPAVDPFSLRHDKEEVVSLEERGQRSRAGDADLVLSLHVDSANSPQLRCSSGYYWPGNTVGAQVAVTVVRSMPFPLARKSGYGVFAARDSESDKWLQRARNVIQVHEATAVLIELGYCSSETDLAALLDSTTQVGIMLALMAGIVRFQQLT